MGYNDEAWLGLKEIKPQKKIGSNFYYASLQPTTSLTRARSAPPSELTTTPKKDTKKRNVDTPPHQPQRKRQPPVLRKARSAPLKISTDASTPQKTLIEIPTVEEVEEEEVQPVKVRTRNSVKKRLTLVVVGHVDAGKSTLMGHLLYVVFVFERKCSRAKRENLTFITHSLITLTRITFITHLLITLTRITCIIQNNHYSYHLQTLTHTTHSQ